MDREAGARSSSAIGSTAWLSSPARLPPAAVWIGGNSMLGDENRRCSANATSSTEVRRRTIAGDSPNSAMETAVGFRTP